MENPFTGDRIVIKESGSCAQMNEMLAETYVPKSSADYIVEGEPWPHAGECVIFEFGGPEEDPFVMVAVAFSEQFDDYLKIR